MPAKKKAPDPKAYWKQLAEELSAKDPVLVKEILHYHFKHWDSDSIRHGADLAQRAISIVGNVHAYALSSYVTGIRNALVDLDRAKTVPGATRGV